MAIGNVLVVEDDKEWQGIFLRNVKPEHSGALRIAGSLPDALRAIEEMAFAVAFVDIRLDEGDDQNTDGLRVLEALNKAGDRTSAIMVTGHGTVAITRDALKEYDAYEAIAKGDVDPDEIQQLVVKGTDQRNTRANVEDPKAPEVLRGRRTVWDWDSEMLEVTGSKGGADGLYRLVESLANPFLPLVNGSEENHLKRRDGTGVAIGSFWSRAIGQGIVIVFGQAEAMDELKAQDDLKPFAGESLGQVLREREKGGLAGFVAAVPGLTRSSFS